MDLILVHVVVVVDIFPVLILVDLDSIGLILATSRLLLVLGVPVDSLHHNVSTLWIDPVVGVDVPLERDAEDPPSAAEEGKADEKSKQEKRASDRDGNCASLSQTFYSGNHVSSGDRMD